MSVLSSRDMRQAGSSYAVPSCRRPDHSLAVPGSKSLTNRALVIAALSDGLTRLSGALVAEDSEVMKDGLRRLGFVVEDRGTDVEIRGLSGEVPAHRAELDLRLSGTSMRFLAAVAALGSGEYFLDGNSRMRERPIEDLLAALRVLGANARSVAGNGCPPVMISGRGLTGGRVTVAGDRSSQFLSALLMAAPYARSETEIVVTGELQSKPFADMTARLMSDFGVNVERDGYRRFRVPVGCYGARDYRIEGDAMAAGYFWAAAAVTGGTVRIENLGADSVQGDARLAKVLEAMGCRVDWGQGWCRLLGPTDGRLRGGSFDLNDMPDQAQTLAVLALFADSPVEILAVPNLRIKETDRLSALARELAKFGAGVEERPDSLLVVPPDQPQPARVETYGDHRMAMSFAVAGLVVPGTEILDPDCVAKTYPAFFRDLEELAATGLRL